MRQGHDFLTEAVRNTLDQLGQRIRRARKARKLSLSQLEQITRIHRSTLGRLELGDPGVSIGGLLAVLEALQSCRISNCWSVARKCRGTCALRHHL
jgi:ribosome-binding protein aMBF1 (putative translation factor)